MRSNQAFALGGWKRSLAALAVLCLFSLSGFVAATLNVLWWRSSAEKLIRWLVGVFPSGISLAVFHWVRWVGATVIFSLLLILVFQCASRLRPIKWDGARRKERWMAASLAASPLLYVALVMTMVDELRQLHVYPFGPRLSGHFWPGMVLDLAALAAFLAILWLPSAYLVALGLRRLDSLMARPVWLGAMLAASMWLAVLVFSWHVDWELYYYLTMWWGAADPDVIFAQPALGILLGFWIARRGEALAREARTSRA